jgi:hypothetical protein
MQKITALEYIINSTGTKPVELANQLNVSRQRLNSWIQGLSKIPDEFAEKMSFAFQLPKEIIQKKSISLGDEIFIDEELIVLQDAKVKLKRRKIHGIDEQDIENNKKLKNNKE